MYDDFQIEHQHQTSFPTCPHDFGLPLLTATKIWTIPIHAKLIGGVPSKEGGSQIMPSVPLVIPHLKEGMKTTRVAVHVLVYDTHVQPNYGSCCLVVK